MRGLPDDEELLGDQIPELALVDCRPMLQGWHLLFVYSQRVSHAALEHQLSYFLPAGHQVLIEGAQLMGTDFTIAAGQVLCVQFVRNPAEAGTESDESESGSPDAPASEASRTESVGQDTTTAPADSEGGHLFDDDPRFCQHISRSRSRSPRTEPAAQDIPHARRGTERSRSRSPSAALACVAAASGVPGAAANVFVCEEALSPACIPWQFWCWGLLFGAIASHVPAVLTCSLLAAATSTGRPQGTFRRLAVRPTVPASPAYLSQLEALSRSPCLRWDRPVDDHYRDLVQGWRSAGEAIQPPAAPVPTQSYIQPHTLFLVHTRRGLREYLWRERRELDRRRLLLGFAAFLHLRRRTVFPPQAVRRYEDWIRDVSVSIARVASRITLTGLELRTAVRADRAAYLANLVQDVSLADLRDPKHLFRAVRRAFPKASSKRRQAFTPLPAVVDAQGQFAPDRAGRQELWRGHFASLESGEKLEPGAYPAAFREQRRATSIAPPCFDFRLVPTLTSVEQNVLGLRKGKACGQDGFTAELLQLSAVASARALLPVFVKSILGVQEPVEFRGGALMPLAKKAATAFTCSKFRAILLSSLPSKLLHKHLRNCLSVHFQPRALQAGALPGISTESVALAARAFQSLCHATGQSWALIFFDVRSAFYCVVRQLLLPVGDSDRALQELFHKLHLPPTSLQELRAHLESLATVSAAGCSQHLQRVATDVLQGTWFRLDRDAVLTLTHCGTRPGDSLADLLFGFAFSAYLRAAEQALQEAGLATPMPSAGSPDPWELPDLPSNLGCGSWADDFVHLHAQSKPIGGLSRSVQRITSIYVSQADSIGMSLTFAKDKTAVLLPPHASEKDAEWLGDTDSEGPFISGRSSTSGQSFRLPVVSAYCHLGGIVTACMTPAPGIGLRYALAANTVRSLGRKLFGSRHIPLDTRRCLLRSLVLSKFVFGSAVIRFGSALHYRTWTRYYIALWRALFAPNPHLKTPHAYEVLAKAQAPTPPLALALARSVLLRQLATTGPVTLVRLLWVQWEADPRHSFLAAVAKDIDHAAQYVEAARVLMAARSPVRTLLEAVADDAAWWTRQLKKAVAVCAGDIQQWMHNQAPARSRGLDSGLQRPPGPSTSPQVLAFSCEECGAMFPLRKHLAVHYARRHGRIAITRRLAPTSTCLACMKHFDSPVRVQYHLKSSAACLSRTARLIRPLSLEEVREAELATKSLKRKVDHGSWELFRTPQLAGIAAGPRILTAQERAEVACPASSIPVPLLSKRSRTSSPVVQSRGPAEQLQASGTNALADPPSCSLTCIEFRF